MTTFETHCAYCGHENELISQIVRPGAPTAGPSAGDWIMCFSCGEWNVFTAAKTLRLPTLEEAAERDGDEELKTISNAWRKVMRPE